MILEINYYWQVYDVHSRQYEFGKVEQVFHA